MIRSFMKLPSSRGIGEPRGFKGNRRWARGVSGFGCFWGAGLGEGFGLEEFWGLDSWGVWIGAGFGRTVGICSEFGLASFGFSFGHF